MPEPVRQEELLTHLERGALVLLPGSFAASALRSAYDTSQRTQGLGAWSSPRVSTWTEWTRSLWTQLVTEGAETRLLLNAAQEESLWLQLIAGLSAAEQAASGLDALARLARSGYGLAETWGITFRLRATASTHDTRTFAKWAEAFQHHCREHGYLPGAALDAVLARHLRAGAFAAPSQVLLVGFEEFTPAQNSLLAALRAGPCEVNAFALVSAGASPPTRPHRLLVRADDERQELALATQWARQQVVLGQQRGLDTRVGFVLPETGIDTAELESVFREVLAPELQCVEADLSSAPWEFADGEPLLQASVAHTALELLHFCLGPISLGDVSGLLLSPYLGSTADRHPNARFDVKAVRGDMRLRPDVSLRELALLSIGAPRMHPEAPPPAAWLAELHAFADRSLHTKLRRSFSEWMEVARQALKLAGWPGERPLSARDRAALRAWDDTLDRVATLDFAGHRVSFEEALAAVARQARSATVRSTNGSVPVVALRPQQAIGCQWDALVFLRGSEEHWPPVVRLHPLISAALQREYGLPGTRAGQTPDPFPALLAASGDALVSCAIENADGPLRPSPLFARLGFTEASSSGLALEQIPVARVKPDVIWDDAALPGLPAGELRGGARVLQLQAACGFLAFSDVRLKAAEPPTRELGLDDRETGILLHHAIEAFWREVKSQEALRQLPRETRRALLERCIDASVPRKVQTQDAWEEAYLQLQKRRLRALLESWLDHELRRSPFTVAASEHKEIVSVGPLTLKVRVDRLDEVEGGVVLVDYKSGSAANPTSWLGDRPEQPQLPLYSLLHDPESVRAVTFAHLRAGSAMRWNGFQVNTGILPSRPGRDSSRKTQEEFTGQLKEWRSTLDQLATDFSEGRADVDPKELVKTCKDCAHRMLCRVDSTSLHELALLEEELLQIEDFDG